jgi:hypothetical protein
MSTGSLDKAIEAVMETSSMASGAVSVAPVSPDDLDEESELSEDDKVVEEQLRGYIRNKISLILNEKKEKLLREEKELRKIIRKLILESDVSDMHPHRSTGINTLEDLLKKVVPTLRTDYKRLTTDKAQRDSFRAHMLKAIKDSLVPSIVNAQPAGEESMMLQTPQDTEELETDLELSEELYMLDEIDVDIADDDADPEKMIPVEDDDVPSDEEAFGIEGEDETGRNMAFATNKKIQQYILDAFDSLANEDDRKTFITYLITNVKLYFDKFEDELQITVEEPTTPEYEQAKGGNI